MTTDRVAAMQDETRDIPLDQIVEPWVVLRVVNRTSVEYMELRDSLADHGFFNSICVRPCKRKEGKMEVVDGLYRFAAATELHLPTAPCIVKHNLTDEDVLAIQIQANALRSRANALHRLRRFPRRGDRHGLSVCARASRHPVSRGRRKKRRRPAAEEGYRAVCRDKKLTPRMLSFSSAAEASASVPALASMLIDAPHSFTAIFAENDSLALLVLAASAARGIRIPGSLSLLGYGDIPTCALPPVWLTTIGKNANAMALMAVDTLSAQIARGTEGGAVRMLSPVLIERGTCGKIEKTQGKA